MNYVILNKKLSKTYGLKEALILGYKFLNPKASKEAIAKTLKISRKEFSRLGSKSTFLSYEFPENFSKLPHWRIYINDIETIGINESLVLAHLKDLYYMFQCEFFQKQEKMAEQLPLTVRQIRSATKNLVEAEYLFVERKGYNKNNYYTINFTVTHLQGNKISEKGIVQRVENFKKSKKMKSKDQLKAKQHLSIEEMEPVIEISLADLYNDIENTKIDYAEFYRTKNHYRNTHLDKAELENSTKTKPSEEFLFNLCYN